MQFRWEIFTLNPVDCITVEVKKLVVTYFTLVPLWYSRSRKQIYQDKNETIRIAPKHNNSLETLPYAMKMQFAMHQSFFTLQMPS